MAQDQWTLQEKERKSTGARAATAVPRCSCQQGSPCNFATILAHMVMNKGRGNIERGQTMMRAAGMAWQRWAGKHSLQSKAVAGKHSRQTIRPVQASQQNNSQQMKLASLLPCSAGRWRECGGAGHSEGGLGPTKPSPSQPIAFACLRPYPLS